MIMNTMHLTHTHFAGAYETVRRCLNYHVRCLNSLQSTATMMVFTLAMVLYPDVQKRAQAEIDSVVGKYRLPTFEDRDSLPYVNATMREVLRWGIVAPLGNLCHPCDPMPLLNIIYTGTLHATSKEDSYNGYLIPKGLPFAQFRRALKLNTVHRGGCHIQRMVRWCSILSLSVH